MPPLGKKRKCSGQAMRRGGRGGGWGGGMPRLSSKVSNCLIWFGCTSLLSDHIKGYRRPVDKSISPSEGAAISEETIHLVGLG